VHLRGSIKVIGSGMDERWPTVGRTGTAFAGGSRHDGGSEGAAQPDGRLPNFTA
jgi:hypothetical protein